jgi:sucrose phosphorylase
MDLNAESEVAWSFYDATLKTLADYGGKLIRLDAFAYLHKAPGLSNFFNKPGTWVYLDRLKAIAERYALTLLPEIHAQYGTHLHTEVSRAGYPIYDFFLPGLLIDALERGTNEHLLPWIAELQRDGIRTVNMLGCHDGIPVLDLAGAEVDGEYRPGLLTDSKIEHIMERILSRGGRVKSLFGPDGKKIAYYQVNATYFSALGEDEQKLLLARAVQLFMPGIPQVWYLDLFAGTNDYAAADRGGSAGHKEINRTSLTSECIEQGLEREVVLRQLEMMRLRNTSSAFDGTLHVADTPTHELNLTWMNGTELARLTANLDSHRFSIRHVSAQGEERTYDYPGSAG